MAIQKDVLEKKLEEQELPKGEKRQIQLELGNIKKRWESERCHRVDKETRTLLTSQDWADIQLGSQIGWKVGRTWKKQNSGIVCG